jgi:excisionase family DNA binding protein
MQQPTADGKKRRAAAESAASGRLMTLQEVADYPRVTRATIHRMLKRNQIPTFRIGGHWRFNLEEIDNWCASQVRRR